MQFSEVENFIHCFKRGYLLMSKMFLTIISLILWTSNSVSYASDPIIDELVKSFNNVSRPFNQFTTISMSYSSSTTHNGELTSSSQNHSFSTTIKDDYILTNDPGRYFRKSSFSLLEDPIFLNFSMSGPDIVTIKQHPSLLAAKYYKDSEKAKGEERVTLLKKAKQEADKNLSVNGPDAIKLMLKIDYRLGEALVQYGMDLKNSGDQLEFVWKGIQLLETVQKVEPNLEPLEKARAWWQTLVGGEKFLLQQLLTFRLKGFYEVLSAKRVSHSFPGLSIETDESKGNHQLISKPFPINKRVDNVLNVQFNLIEGGFFIGLLGLHPNKFLDYKSSTTVGLQQLTLSLPHKTPDPNVKLVIANNRWSNPGVSRFVLFDLDYYAIPVKATVEILSAKAVDWTKEGIDVTTDVSISNHQLRSSPYAYKKDEIIVYPFEIGLKAGGLLIGFLAADEKSFLTHKVFSNPGLIEDILVLPAGTPKSGVRLVIANQNKTAESSYFIIRSLPKW